jgi:hypothetical protein
MANSTNALDDHTRAFLQMEYGVLRGELIKRVEFRQRLIEITLIAAGAILALKPLGSAYGRVLLGYPVLVMFLAAGWLHQDLRVRRLATYVRTCIEPAFQRRTDGDAAAVGYETWATQNNDGKDAYIGNLANIFMFIAVQVLFLLLGTYSLITDGGGVVDLEVAVTLIVTLATAIILVFYRQWRPTWKIPMRSPR